MATVGEVQYCGRETRGQIVTLRYFNGRPVVSLGGGHNKIFVVEEKGAVSALHPLENELDAFGEEQELSIEKQNLENLGELKMIRCGRGHTLYLTQDGFVFASGKGAFGVLGLGGALNSPTPVTVKTLSDKTVVMVACGSEHSLALTDMGDVYSWGRGFEGQLGISKLTTVSSTPKYLKALRDRPVTKIACGQSHSLVLTKAGELFAWGEGRCGQLGCGVQRACFVPQQVVFTAPHQITIVDIAGGSGHSGAVTASGDLYMWGLNNYGQLGVGDQKPRFYPTPVLQDVVGVYLHDIKQLSCSDYSSFVIDTQGRLYSWGKGFIGHNDETLELLPRKVELNTEHRRFSQLYAAGSVFACFAPLHVYSISPYCGPVTGGTKLSLIGTAFAQSEELRVRFRYEGNVVERPCEFDQETSSLVCFTPSFQDEGEDLTLPCACELEVTMDGEHYVPCDEKFLVYAKDLQPTALNPKCAAVNGSTVLQIDIDLEAFQQAWLWHLTVGFAVKPKAKAFASPAAKREANHTPSHDESRMSQASARGGESSSATDVEWHLTAGKYEKGHVTCKVPVITNYDENSMAYMVDIAPNGQQFTGKPLNFRYYDVTVSSVAPLSGSINAGTTVVISGRGLYDSSAKKLHLSSESGGRREVVLEWDRKNKTYIGLIPPLSWLFKGSEPDSYTLKQFAKEDISMQLTLNGMNFIPLPSFHYIDITITRFSKAKLDPALPPDKAQQVWLAEEPLVQGEPPEVKQKREADEATEMNVSVRPGGKIYIWVEDLVKAEGLTARFMVEGKTADVMAVYKNSQKAGAVVPDLGDFQTPVEVRVELSMNGQSFSETGKVLKYLGATAPEEGGKRRGKGAPWTRSSLSSFAQPGSGSPDASFAGSRAGMEPGRLRSEQAYSGPGGLGDRTQTYQRAAVQRQPEESILSFPSAIRRPNEEELRRAKQQELMHFYHSAIKEKSLRGKEDITLDPLKHRAAEVSLQYQRERALTRKAVSSSILAADEPPPTPQRQDYLAQVQDMRKRKVELTVAAPAYPTRAYQENAALFYGEPPSASSPKAYPKATFSPPQNNQKVKSFAENSALFYGENSSQTVIPPKITPVRSGESRRSLEENKALFYGVEKANDPGSLIATPILGKTVPKSTVSDPITGQIRTISSEKPRYAPLGGPKLGVFVGKINDSPAPPASSLFNQPSYTKKSGYRPSNYNPLTGQELGFSPFNGARY